MSPMAVLTELMIAIDWTIPRLLRMWNGENQLRLSRLLSLMLCVEVGAYVLGRFESHSQDKVFAHNGFTVRHLEVSCIV